MRTTLSLSLSHLAFHRAFLPPFTPSPFPNFTMSTSTSLSASDSQTFSLGSSIAPNEAHPAVGYLDDQPSSSTSSSSSSVTHTSLFAHLAQRQLDQSRSSPSREEYDDPHSWTTRRRTRSESSESYDSEDSRTSSQLQKEWDEQVEQMKLMFQIIIFPFVGKFFGRKFGYYRKYQPLLSYKIDRRADR